MALWKFGGERSPGAIPITRSWRAQKTGNRKSDFLRTALQTIMEGDAEELIGAGRHERHTDRLNYHHG